MYLKYLEINGFKSFPDRVKLEFGRGITAVVGPNGSGKSNISDAVRWVLGEQSSKTLRGDRMEDVIFGGTQLRRPMGFAQVTLTIGNEDRDLPVDSDEISISRKLYRSGDSEYRINNNAVRLKDVHELFMDTGLGRDGYSMIGQGKISEIISAKSTQRREIFEEAAGISRYRYRKTEAERKLAQTQENLLRLKDIMTELEDRIGPLKAQSDKAKRFVELAERRRELELSLWVAQLEKMTSQLRELSDQQTVTRLGQSQVEEELAGLEQQIESLFTSMQQASAKMESLRGEIAELEEAIFAGESQAAVLQNDISHNERSAKALEEETLSDEESRQAFERFMEEKEAQKAALIQKDESIAQRMESLVAETGERQGALQRLTDSLLEKRQEESRLAFAISEQKVLSATRRNSLEEAKERKAMLAQSEEEKAGRLESCRKELAGCRSLLETLDGKLESLSNSARGVGMKLESRRKKQEAAQSEKERLDLKIKEQSQRIALLEELERNMEGFAHSVRSVLKQSQKGALGGIHGALSSLIKVENRYLTAIETAMGGALQHIVTEDETAAKKAIALLKSTNAGRATFLPLTAIKGRRFTVEGLEDFDGFLGIASQLVSFEERYRGVVESVLGRVAVVTDLDEGVRMAKRHNYQFRIVTLDGQLINAGGSMTGGSVAKSTGILSRRGEIDACKAQMQSLSQKAAGMEEELLAIGREVSALTAQMQGIEGERKTAAEDQIRYGAEEKRLAEMVEDLTADQDRSAKQQQTLQNQIEQLAARCEEDTAALLKQEAVMKNLEEELRLLEQKTQSARLKKEQTALMQSDLQLERMAVAQEMALLEQAMDEQKKRRADRQEQLESVKEKIEELYRQNDTIRERIDAIGEETAQKRVEIEKRRDEITQQTGLRQRAEGEATHLRQQEKDILVKKEKYAGELLRLEDKAQTVQKEYDGIISKMWDEYEVTRSQAAQTAQPVEDVHQANRALGENKSKIRALGTVNLEAIEEYEQVSQRYGFLSEQMGDVERSRAKLQSLIQELTVQMRELFTDSFGKINDHFGRIFVELFGGGKAQLRLTEGEDVLESGIEIFVQPPGKIIKNLAALSGGEQAFVAIAIYFAILKVRPAPFCLLDEIEAALDDVNVNKYAQYLQRLNQNSQFIAITHRRGTMEHADVLYGVTMQEEGVSKLLTLEVSEIENKLGMKNI